MRQPLTILQQQVIAEIQRNGTEDPRVIAQRVGCGEYSVYRIAQEFGLEVHRERKPRSAATGIINIRLIPTKRKGLNTYAMIPVPALRAAGLHGSDQLRFRAESGRIVIEKMPEAAP